MVRSLEIRWEDVLRSVEVLQKSVIEQCISLECGHGI